MRLQDGHGQVLSFVTDFKYLDSFVQNDAGQDKELNRSIGSAAMIFGKVTGMVFTSKKVSFRVEKCIQPFSQGLGSRVQVLGSRSQGPGSRWVQGPASRVQGPGITAALHVRPAWTF